MMFLDGPGGSGKSRLVKELLKYAKEYTSLLKLKFDMLTIVVSARSGVAAVSIGGETTHFIVYMNSKIPADDDTTWANARLLIIDEVSFMSVQEVELLDEKLRTLMQRHNSLYGGINVIFCGDFRQLEPVTWKPLYSTKHSNKKWINSINCYVELLGLWRFQNDPRWGQILSRIRNDMYTSHDINAINKCALAEKRPKALKYQQMLHTVFTVQ
jgi:ATP-dependent DNA helicase PIF1